MADDIINLLERHGPSLTSELIDAMVTSGATSAAARQRITRAQPNYTRLAGLRFAKNARFIYLEDQFGDEKFWAALERAFQAGGQSYWAAVVGLKSRGGRCPTSMFPSVCGAPLARNRQLSPDRIMERLSAIQLIEEITDEVTGDSFVQFRPYSYPKSPTYVVNAVLLAEYVALFGIKEWARRIGFGSYGKFLMRGDDKLPVVSAVAWDMTAPSYMRPLVSARGGSLKPGFFVCDVNLNGPVDEDAVAVFIRKHDMASAPANVAPIMPFLVGDVFTDDAFNLARKSGVVATTVSHLFGDETAKALRDLIGLLTDTGATAAVNADHIYRVMTSLTKIEGAANNLRGALFELVVGNLVKNVEDGFLRTGEKWTDYETGRSAETDVLLDRPDDGALLVIECKSKIPGASVSLEEVQKWYSDRVPLLWKILSSERRYAGRQFRFEFWSNGPMHASATRWLDKQTSDLVTYSVGWRDGASMKEYAARAKSASIRKILNEHYFLHPLANRGRAIAA